MVFSFQLKIQDARYEVQGARKDSLPVTRSAGLPVKYKKDARYEVQVKIVFSFWFLVFS